MISNTHVHVLHVWLIIIHLLRLKHWHLWLVALNCHLIHLLHLLSVHLTILLLLHLKIDEIKRKNYVIILRLHIHALIRILKLLLSLQVLLLVKVILHFSVTIKI